MFGECFDPKGDLHVSEHCRPHWSQAGAVVFITFRTHDSVPREVLERWDREKQDWLHKRGWNTGAHWSAVIKTLPDQIRANFQKMFNRSRERFFNWRLSRSERRHWFMLRLVGDGESLV